MSGRKNECTWISSAIFVLSVCLACTSARAEWIDFSGISPTALPMTFDFSTGSVTVTEISAPAAGTAQLFNYIPSPGTNGYENPVGGVKMGILDKGSGTDSWEVEFTFNQPETITVHNTETYCNFEDTTLLSDNDWSQIDGSSNLSVTGLGTKTISLVGAYGASGPFGYGHWTTTTTDLFMTYALDNGTGSSAGNGLEIQVPEPAMGTMALAICGVALMGRRAGRFGAQRPA